MVDDLVNPFSICFALIVASALLTAAALQAAGRRGRLFWALLVSASAGAVVFLVLFFYHSFFFPVPVSFPPTVVDPKVPLLAQMMSGFYRAIADGAGEEVGRMVDPVVYGLLAMAVAFGLGLVIPWGRSVSRGGAADAAQTM